MKAVLAILFLLIIGVFAYIVFFLGKEEYGISKHDPMGSYEGLNTRLTNTRLKKDPVEDAGECKIHTFVDHKNNRFKETTKLWVKNGKVVRMELLFMPEVMGLYRTPTSQFFIKYWKKLAGGPPMFETTGKNRYDTQDIAKFDAGGVKGKWTKAGGGPFDRAQVWLDSEEGKPAPVEVKKTAPKKENPVKDTKKEPAEVKKKETKKVASGKDEPEDEAEDGQEEKRGVGKKDGSVAMINLSSSDFWKQQRRYQDRKYRLVCLNIYNSPDGEIKYLSVWHEGKGAPVVIEKDLDKNSYQLNFDSMVKKKYNLRNIMAYQKDGNAVYASVWAKEDGSSFKAKHGLDEQEFSIYAKGRDARNYVMKNLAVCMDRDVPRFSGVWRKQEGKCRYELGLSIKELQKEAGKNQKAGYHLSALSAYKDGGKTKYAVLWGKENDASYKSVYCLKEDSFKKKCDDMKAEGYRPVYINGHIMSGQTRFAAVWMKGESGGGSRVEEEEEDVEAVEKDNAKDVAAIAEKKKELGELKKQYDDLKEELEYNVALVKVLQELSRLLSRQTETLGKRKSSRSSFGSGKSSKAAKLPGASGSITSFNDQVKAIGKMGKGLSRSQKAKITQRVSYIVSRTRNSVAARKSMLRTESIKASDKLRSVKTKMVGIKSKYVAAKKKLDELED